ncbi:hypothetical protein Maes01_00197 [Microbulbifer aestuariivivens]|uniref:Sel1 repeat family protein n=1 Tax=Microbulbifer aestuariivivens TaxID=1908308 RepID=A0ABP9WM25_9GAMM
MKLYYLAFLLFASAVVAAPYQYPKIVNVDTSCTASDEEIAKINEKYFGYPDCSPEIEIKPVDLNGDMKCEFYVTADWGRRCTSVTTIVSSKENGFKNIGNLNGGAINTSAEKKNGYYRLINYTWGGHRTNIIYTANVLYFDGSSFECEFCKDNSSGGYMDLAKKAYDKKDYALAEIYYWNAFAMNGERKLSDANNLSLAYLKNGKKAKLFNF